MNPEDRLQRARCLLVTYEPWYGHAAMNMTWIASPETETMGVRVVEGGEVHCLYSPAFVSSLNVLELCTVIQHEVEHVVRCHCLRLGDKHLVAWNLAADMTVNGPQHAPRIGLVSRDAGRAIPHRESLVWIPPFWPTEENAEYYYHRLLEEADLAVLGRALDDHTLWEQSDVDPGEMEEIAVALAEDAAHKCQGAMPGHVRRAIQSLGRAQIPWHVLLRRYMRVCLHDRRTTYTRRNRRRDLFGLPGHVRRRKGHVSVIVDVSGSISTSTLRQFFAELERMCTSARIDVLLWDAKFQGFTANYRRGDWQRIRVRGGGGTDMAAPAEWLVQRRLTGDCVILLTDGLCNWPAPGRFSLISVITCPCVSAPAWGRVVWLGSSEAA